MKSIHLFNAWSYGITLGLYVTIYFGLIAQFILGIIQVIIAIYLLIKGWNNSKVMEMIGLYFLLILIYFITSFTLLSFEIGNQITMYLFAMILPMSIASYFVFITSQIHKKYADYVR